MNFLEILTNGRSLSQLHFQVTAFFIWSIFFFYILAKNMVFTLCSIFSNIRHVIQDIKISNINFIALQDRWAKKITFFTAMSCLLYFRGSVQNFMNIWLVVPEKSKKTLSLTDKNELTDKQTEKHITRNKVCRVQKGFVIQFNICSARNKYLDEILQVFITNIHGISSVI